MEKGFVLPTLCLYGPPLQLLKMRGTLKPPPLYKNKIASQGVFVSQGVIATKTIGRMMMLWSGFPLFVMSNR